MVPSRRDNGQAPAGGSGNSERRKTVYILTYCPTPEVLYGSILTFKTLRVGFPTAEVLVVDNNSHPEAVTEIRRLADETRCHFRQLPSTIGHYSFLSNVVLDPDNEGTVIILDPDMCFWDKCEDWEFDALLAGRYVPMFYEQYSRCINLSRLHTSFWWIRDVRLLRERILLEYERTSIGYLDPFVPYIYQQDGEWYKFDTGANLYAVIRNETAAFGERELECFDHLMVGTHLDVVAPGLNDPDREFTLALHDRVKRDHTAIKGLWKQQDNYWNLHARQPRAATVEAHEGPLER